MIVDDNQFDREGIRQMIDWDSLGITVAAVANNGKDGLQKALELKPDFVISDISMPFMDGLEMARKIKETLPETKFIFFSCFDKFDYAREAVDLAASAYLLKPVDLEELYNTLLRLTEQREEEIHRKKEELYLKEQLRNSLPILKRQLIQDALYMDLQPSDKATKQLAYLSLENKKYCVVSILLERAENKEIKEDVEQDYMNFCAATQLAEKLLFSEAEGVVIGQGNIRLLCVYMLDGDLQLDPWQKVIDGIDKLKQELLSQYKINLRALVSQIVPDLFGLHKEFYALEKLLSHGYITDRKTIVLAQELDDLYSLSEENLLDGIETRLKAVLESEKDEVIYHFIDSHLPSGQMVKKQDLLTFVYTVVSVLQIELLKKGKSFHDVLDSDTIIWEKLARLDSILNIRNWLYNIILSIKQELYHKNNRFNRIAEDIKKIIDEEYATLQNINEIAQRLYISPNYASNIFKQATGKTIFDYLIEVRMEVAKDLLKNPYSKIYEIADQVGYTSKSYFTVVFREYTGMTPKQYQTAAS